MDIKATYSENLPSADYKTHRWGIEITRQVPDNADAGTITQTLFMVAKASVRAEVERAKGDQALNGMSEIPHLQPPRQPPQLQVHPAPQQQKLTSTPPSNCTGYGQNPKGATPKQIKFLAQLGRRSGLSNEQINALSAQYFGKSTLNDLTAREASDLIDTLSKNQAA